MSDEEHFYDGLDDVDRQIRENREERDRELQGEEDAWSLDENDVPFIREALNLALRNSWNRLRSERRTSYAKMLIEDGISLPCAEELLVRETLSSKLWEVIHGLASRRVYLSNTDHLSDEALYRLLWDDLLNYDTIDISADPSASCHLDVLGGDSDEDVELFLRYYADDEERREWIEELSDHGIPERETAPFDRDRFLPKWGI